MMLQRKPIRATIRIQIRTIARHAVLARADTIIQNHILELAEQGRGRLVQAAAARRRRRRRPRLGAQPRHARPLPPGQTQARGHGEGGRAGGGDAVDDGLAVGDGDGGCLWGGEVSVSCLGRNVWSGQILIRGGSPCYHSRSSTIHTWRL